MKLKLRHLSAFALCLGLIPLLAQAQTTYTLRAATAYNKDHIYNRTLEYFAERLQENYPEGKIELKMYPNGSLGEEKSYFEMMSAGVPSIDYAIVAPGHMTSYTEKAGFLDAPFLFKSQAVWEKAIEDGIFKPIVDDLEKQANVKIVGLTGGEKRNIISNRKADSLEELKGLRIRLQDDPIHQAAFQAIGAVPNLIAYQEIYNAIQSGVIDALENEASTLLQMRFYEVAPNIIKTQHIITVRPIVFNKKTYDSMPDDLKTAVDKAGLEAAAYGRKLSMEESDGVLNSLEKDGKIQITTWSDADIGKMHEAIDPLIAELAGKLEIQSVYDAANQLNDQMAGN